PNENSQARGGGRSRETGKICQARFGGRHCERRAAQVRTGRRRRIGGKGRRGMDPPSLALAPLMASSAVGKELWEGSDAGARSREPCRPACGSARQKRRSARGGSAPIGAWRRAHASRKVLATRPG